MLLPQLLPKGVSLKHMYVSAACAARRFGRPRWKDCAAIGGGVRFGGTVAAAEEASRRSNNRR